MTMASSSSSSGEYDPKTLDSHWTKAGQSSKKSREWRESGSVINGSK